jgi:uncharacterized membrane protein YbhN (UPF0104 family)
MKRGKRKNSSDRQEPQELRKAQPGNTIVFSGVTLALLLACVAFVVGLLYLPRDTRGWAFPLGMVAIFPGAFAGMHLGLYGQAAQEKKDRKDSVLSKPNLDYKGGMILCLLAGCVFYIALTIPIVLVTKYLENRAGYTTHPNHYPINRE